MADKKETDKKILSFSGTYEMKIDEKGQGNWVIQVRGRGKYKDFCGVFNLDEVRELVRGVLL